MYEDFFGFKEKPFNITPDPHYFFPSTKHREALDRLIYAINDKRGFVVITGDVGAGKTILCRTLLTKLKRGTKVAVVTNTYLSNKQLILNILSDLDVPHDVGDKFKLISQLNEFLIDQHALDNNVIVIVDEAQNLSRNALEEVRMLSNLETAKAKLIQIVLMGQPELKEMLRHRNLAQLRQRVAIHYHISPLNLEETDAYIKYRLQIGSADNMPKDDLFTPEAISLLFRFSGGVPRLINIICDNALLTAFAHDLHQVDSEIIYDAVKDNAIFDRDDNDRAI